MGLTQEAPIRTYDEITSFQTLYTLVINIKSRLVYKPEWKQSHLSLCMGGNAHGQHGLWKHT